MRNTNEILEKIIRCTKTEEKALFALSEDQLAHIQGQFNPRIGDFSCPYCGEATMDGGEETYETEFNCYEIFVCPKCKMTYYWVHA